MDVRYESWEATNNIRAYPLSDEATLRDDAGLEVPYGLLVDASVWVPGAATSHVFVSSYAITPELVSCTLSVAPTYDTPVFNPVALAVCPRAAGDGPFKPVKITPLMNSGAAGWLTFGSLGDAGAAGNLSTARQGLLHARALADGEIECITSISANGANALTGAVQAVFDAPFAVTVEGGRVCVGLAADAEILSKFAGAYNTRGGCRRVPVMVVHGVEPDDSGNITLTYNGFNVTPETHGTCLASGISQETYCLGKKGLPDEYGVIPLAWESEEESLKTPVEVTPAGLGPTDINAGDNPNWYESGGTWYGTATGSGSALNAPTAVVNGTISSNHVVNAPTDNSASVTVGPVTASRAENDTWTIYGSDTTVAVAGATLTTSVLATESTITVVMNGTTVYDGAGGSTLEQVFQVLTGSITVAGFRVEAS